MGGAIASEFQPSSDFAKEAAGREAGKLPWGIGSPRAGDSLPVFQYSGMPFIDVPKELEYSLETGDNIQTFSTAQQDIKLITQVLENVTNGFFIDSHAGLGEEGSNTLLLELTGWRGLCIEPRVYHFMTLWGKMRKAWLFLGAISPHENATKLGFDYDGKIDMLSGHKIHAYPVTTFLSEMGGRRTIDFWNLHNGGYEAEVLNETLLGGGKYLEFGVVLIRFDGRRSGRGSDYWVEMRSKDATEEVVFEIMHNASFVYIGGLDAYWVNQVSPRFNYKDSVFINPSYFQKRGLPIPWKVKSAPPPPLAYPRSNQSWNLLGPWEQSTSHPEGYDSWDSGFSKEEETDKVIAYIKKAKEKAQPQEPVAKASRVTAGSLVY
jgi:hypothetical protein